MCQLSSAQLLCEGLVATRQLSCQVSCNLSAELHPVDTSAEQCYLSSAAIYQLTATRPVAVSSI